MATMDTNTTPTSLRPWSRRGIGLALAVVALAALAGCGDDEPGDPAAGAPADPVVTTTETETTTTEAAPHEGPLEIVAADYRFEGLPARVAAGTHRITFENQGTEAHELFLFRNPDGLSLHEIAELGPEGAPEAVDLVTLLVAVPGAAAEPTDVDLTPGEYVVACFIPAASDGRGHFEHGMQAAFTVT
jgi:hypothetical protein